MIQPFTRLLIIAAACMALTACASSVTPPARYMLPSPAASSAPSQPTGTLAIRAPRLAHYLDVDGIVMQLDDITLNQAREHQWAEGIGRQLERSLRAQLAQQLPQLQVVRSEGALPDALTLSVEVDQFQGRHDGMAVASGQWQLRREDNSLVTLQSFTTQTPLEEDGYPALVRALGESWNLLSVEIAEQIRRNGYFTGG